MEFCELSEGDAGSGKSSGVLRAGEAERSAYRSTLSSRCRVLSLSGVPPRGDAIPSGNRSECKEFGVTFGETRGDESMLMGGIAGEDSITPFGTTGKAFC